MLINLFILSSCSKTNDFCVLKSIKSNRQSNYTVSYKACKENDSFIDFVDFKKYIASALEDRINFTLFGFDRNFPLTIDLSKTNIKYFDIRGGEKNQFIYLNGIKNDITIQGTRINILFEKTQISFKAAILSKSIIYSPNGKINLFVNSLITDGFSLKNNFFTNISCYHYKLTSRIKPTAKINVLYDSNNLYFDLPNSDNFLNNYSQKSEASNLNSTSQKATNPNLTNHYYHKIVNLHKKDQTYNNNKSQLLESAESFQQHFLINNDIIDFPPYIQNLLDISTNIHISEEINEGDEILNSTEVKYCLCMKSRLNRCKDSVECDSYFIPLENYVTGKESWFKSDISHSVNRTIRLYITGTEGMTMNIGFEDFLGKNNTIYFILANPNSPAYISVGGKYMSSSTSQLAVFSAIFHNIDRVSINSDIIQKLNDVTLRQSPLFIRPSHHLTIHRLITDTRSIVSFEGTLYISDFLVLNNSEPLMLEGTLFLDEGCIVYVPQISFFPNVFINDEYILFSDEDQDNDLVLYFCEITDNTKKWTFYMSNEIIIEDGQTYPSVNFYLKTNSESVIPLLFTFDIRYQGISLIFDDISKLSKTIEFDVVTSEDDKSDRSHFLEIQVDYTDMPKSDLFKRISGNIDLVLLTSKTIQYFLGNVNPPSCFDQINSDSPDCKGVNLYGLNSLTFYVYFSMTKIVFQDDSIMIYFGTEMISFSTSLTNSIQVIAEIETELLMSIVPGSQKLFPLSLIVINNNSVINFDQSFDYIVDSGDTEQAIPNWIYILHENLNIDLVASDIKKIPPVLLDDKIEGVLFNTSSEIEYDVTKSTNFSSNSFRSGPNVTVNILDSDVTVPQSSFLAKDVTFCGRPFIFAISSKSRCTYIFENDVKVKVLNIDDDSFNETLTVFSRKSVRDIVDGYGGFYTNSSAGSEVTQKAEFFRADSGYKLATVKKPLSFNANLRLTDESSVQTNIVNIHGLIFTKSGKFAQNDDRIPSPNTKLNLSVDEIECQTVAAISEPNFNAPINVLSHFTLTGSTVKVINLGLDCSRISDTNRSSCFLRQSSPDAMFDVVYVDDSSETRSFLNSNSKSEVQTITLSVMNKETQIMKNFRLFVNSPARIFFDSTWYNVTNPEDLIIVASRNITMQTELIKMPNFTVKMIDPAVKTVIVNKPKHTSAIAFYTFLALAIAIFISCVVFCLIDFCCVLKPKSVEIDLDSTSSDRSVNSFQFSSSSSSLYEYYSEDELANDDNDNDVKPVETKKQEEKGGISITAYGNTTAEWRAEHLRKRRKRPKEEEEEDLNDGKKKKKKKMMKNRAKKKKQENKKLINNNNNDDNDLLSVEENYYDEN